MERPVLSCPAEVTVAADLGSCSASNVVLGTPSTNDNCGVASVVNDGSESYPVGTNAVVWTVTDVNGNSSSCTQQVIVVDNQVPSISCPADVGIGTDPGQCSAINVVYTVSASDNCTNVAVECSPASGSTFPIGTNSVTCTVTDGSGNTNGCSFTVAVSDTEVPSISCAGTATVAVDPGSCSASNVVPGTPSVGDNCGVSTVVNDAPVSYPVGTNAVVWTVTDLYGNQSSCTQQVIVVDDEAPSISCPATVTVNADAGLCSASGAVLGVPASTNDNCGVASVVNDGSGPYPVGTNAVVWTVTDVNGNSSSCTQQVIVVDNQVPSISCPATVIVNADLGQCSVTNVVLGTPTTGDNCGVASVVNDASEPYPVGTNTVVWTVTDASGNSATCTQKVIVVDNQAPSISCPADIVTATDPGQCSASNVTYTVSTSDNCTNVTAVCSPPSGSTFLVGVTAVACGATDAAGNTNSCSFTVTVSDTEAPSISCPAPVTVNADAGLCSASGVALGVPLSTNDNCGVSTVVNDGSEPYPVGTNAVVWTVTDIHGNSSSCTQQVIVTGTDTERPVPSCPGDITVSAAPGQCTSNVSFLATFTDNCVGGSIVCVPGSGFSFPKGTTNVVCTATDASGNSSNCSFTVTVNDTEAPSISCPADVTVSADVGQCSATNVVLGTPSAADNCGVSTVVNDASEPYPVGNNAVVWTVTDVNGNSSSCTQQVIVAVFRIVSIARESNDIRVSWTTASDKTNVLQVATGAAGSFTANFVDLSSPIIVLGTGQVTTNYLDVGGATNAPARYYRVRLVP
jgi:hypothetical protein